MSQTDLIARLEKMATARELVAQQRAQEAHTSEVDGFGTMAKLERQLSKEHATVAADLRAAAAAVRLVGECREALVLCVKLIRAEWFISDVPENESPAMESHAADAALASIADWEGKHGG